MVKKGVTTQAELLELFGGPSVMTTDKDGTEVWMYDKTATTVQGTSAGAASATAESEAAAMGAFLGGIGVGVGATKSSSGQTTQTSHSGSSSVKTLTFIIKFNPDKTVKDYSVRQASY